MTLRPFGALPRKSTSSDPFRSAVPVLAVASSVSREFCDENCVSFMWPWTVLPNGIVPNDVPTPLPVFASRRIAVASMKPPNNRSASPT